MGLCASSEEQTTDSSPIPSNLRRDISDTSTPFFQKYNFVADAKPLGEGGFSIVFPGINTTNKEKCAVKCLFMDGVIQDDPNGEAELRREVSILKSITHENIIACYDFYEDPANRMYWMCLEMVEGGELFDRINDKSFYSEKDARSTTLLLLHALAHMHDLQIAHRDLKPENLLLSPRMTTLS
jgi:serine/threonine protein kinase